VFDPKGVFRKNTKPMLYLGAAALVILAAIFSSYGKKAPASASAKNAAPQPLVQDNTENNVQDLKDQVDAAKQKQAQQAAARLRLTLRLRMPQPRSKMPLLAMARTVKA